MSVRAQMTLAEKLWDRLGEGLMALRSGGVRTERPGVEEVTAVLHPVGGPAPWVQEALYNLVLLVHKALVTPGN